MLSLGSNHLAIWQHRPQFNSYLLSDQAAVASEIMINSRTRDDHRWLQYRFGRCCQHGRDEQLQRGEPGRYEGSIKVHVVAGTGVMYKTDSSGHDDRHIPKAIGRHASHDIAKPRCRYPSRRTTCIASCTPIHTPPRRLSRPCSSSAECLSATYLSNRGAGEESSSHSPKEVNKSRLSLTYLTDIYVEGRAIERERDVPIDIPSKTPPCMHSSSI